MRKQATLFAFWSCFSRCSSSLLARSDIRHEVAMAVTKRR
jgi:hypothetical protein